MPSYVDPKRTAYAPESLLESQDIASVTAGGYTFAQYYDWPPYYVELERLVLEHGAQNLLAEVSADGYKRKMSFQTRAGPLDTAAGPFKDPNRIIARDSLELAAIPESGTADSNITARWNITTRYPTVVDKLRLKAVTKYDVSMNAAEKAIAEKYDLDDLVFAGVAPRNEDLLGDNVFKWFDEIQTVARRIPDISDGDELVVGGELKVPYDKCYTLLAIAFDSEAAAAVAGGITNSELWIKIDRDATNDYMVMDALTMPSAGSGYMSYMDRMFMPALEKIAVRLVNDSGTAIDSTDNLNLRFVYGVRRLTVMDHLLWNYPYMNTSDEARAIRIDEKYGFTEKVTAGVLSYYDACQLANLKLP